MQADIDGAIRAARLIARFDWSWTIQNTEGYLREVGWNFEPAPYLGVVFKPWLKVSEPYGHAKYDPEFFERNGIIDEVKELRILLTDIADQCTLEDHRFLVDSFAELADRLPSELGSPIGRVNVGEPEIVWRLPNAVVFLAMDMQAPSIWLKIVNPDYQSWLNRLSSMDDDDIDNDGLENDEFPRDWSELTTALAMTLSRLPIDGDILLSVPGKNAISCTMDAVKLSCRLLENAGSLTADTLSERDKSLLSDGGWSLSRKRSGSICERMINWPAHYCDFEEMAEASVTVLRSILKVEQPAELQLEAWVSESNAVPDITAFDIHPGH